MGVRQEAVRLSLEDAGFTTTAARAAAVMALLNRSINDVDGSSIRANRSTTILGSGKGGLAQTAVQSRRASADLNQFTGRLNLLVSAATVLGPALVPIGAVGIPAIAGLAAGLGAAVGGIGVAVAAFHGLGDALEALNAFQLDPTEANLEKVKQTLGDMGPAAQDLVFRLDELGPSLKRLQETAQDGIFPGINAGLDDAVALLPRVQAIIRNISETVGGLAATTGDAFRNDADWQAFFTYLEEDAGPTLDDFARATGNFVAGTASLLVAFRPLSDDFSDGLLGMSRDFREWSAELGDSAGFKDFVAYIRENGPAVGEFFGATADAIVALLKAMAPWGSTVLPILTDTAHVFAVIADSPIGPVIFEAAAAMLVLNRSTAAFATISPKVTGGITSMRASLSTLRADLGILATTWVTAGAASQRETARLAAARSRIGQLGGAAKTAAGIGGMLALVDGMGRAGTAAGTLETTLGAAATGFSVGGPWGAAVGAGVGLLLSFSQASAAAAQAAKEFSATLDDQTGAVQAASGQWAVEKLGDAFIAKYEEMGVSAGDLTRALLEGGDAIDSLADRVSGDDLRLSSSGQLYSKAADDLRSKLTGLHEVVEAGHTHWQRTASAVDAAAGATDSLSGAEKYAALFTQQMTEQAEEQAKALEASRDAAQGTAEEFFGLGKSVDDAKVSLGGWLKQLEEQAAALRDFTANAQRAAKQGLDEGLIQSLEEAGPAGALRMKQLANATDAEIARANRAWRRGQKAISDYVNMAVPPKKIEVAGATALSTIKQIKDYLNDLPKSRRIDVAVNYLQMGAKQQALAAVRQADGGTVPGRRDPYGDKTLILAAPGEEVITNRNGEADRFRADRAAGRIPAYADGGTVSYTSGAPAARARGIATTYNIDIDRDDKLKRRINLFGKALDAAKTSLDAETQARDSLTSSITSNLTGSLWEASGSGNAFSSQYAAGSAGSVNALLTQQIATANEQTSLTKQLAGRGLSGGALEELIEQGGIAGLRSFAAASDTDIASYQRLYGQRGTAIATASSTAAGVLGMTSAVKGTTAEVRVLNQTVKQLQAQLKHMQAESKKNAHARGAAMGKVVNGSVKSGVKKRKRR